MKGEQWFLMFVWFNMSLHSIFLNWTFTIEAIHIHTFNVRFNFSLMFLIILFIIVVHLLLMICCNSMLYLGVSYIHYSQV